MRRRGFGATAVTALGAVLVATGCGPQTVQMSPPETDGTTTEVCSEFVAELPDTLLDAERAEVQPDSETMAAWGDPPISLRCGVPRPDDLQPDSLLEEVNGVAWLPQPEDDPTMFTAVGHEAYVELQVPSGHGAPAPALTTVSDLISEHIPPLPDGSL
ncbi:DUF3515 domain-containing protein [Nocardiopsis salina]|uniref:DUF3515 domain-containing protein n=1 Tax=Nocardiopsis salina TaxID=245836 RepID=UPI000346D900|nr:DUF3515 domain-containing protein [Nocardiopsis salina]